MRKREKEIYLDDCGIVSVPGSFASPPRKVTDALSLQSSAEDSGKETDGLRLSAIRRVFNSWDVRDVVNGTNANPTAVARGVDEVITAVIIISKR